MIVARRTKMGDAALWVMAKAEVGCDDAMAACRLKLGDPRRLG
jgi:hypothetical protein